MPLHPFLVGGSKPLFDSIFCALNSSTLKIQVVVDHNPQASKEIHSFYTRESSAMEQTSKQQ